MKKNNNIIEVLLLLLVGFIVQPTLGQPIAEQDSIDDTPAYHEIPATLEPAVRSDSKIDADLKRKQSGNKQRKQLQHGMFEFQDRVGREYLLDIMVAVDLVGQWDNDEPHTTGNRFDVREVEIGFFGAVDHLAEGTLSAAAHQENGETVFELHEAFFYFPDAILPLASARIGKMFLDVGRLNGIHRHDWSFTMAPLVHTELLDEEGAQDTGIELSFLIPWPADHFVQEITVGAYNGRTFGHSHNDGDTKNNPLYTAHLKQFLRLSDQWGTNFGFSYLRYQPTAEPNQVMHQSGLDILLKWKRDNTQSFQILSEVWYREIREKNTRPYDPPANPIETRVGTYVMLQYQFHQEWSAGYRFDFFTNPNYVDVQGRKKAENGHEGNMLMITYRPSEFSYFRATAQRSTELETGKNTYQYYMQADFIMGKHPAHKY